MIVDAIVEPSHLRADLIARYSLVRSRDRHFSDRHHGMPPV